MLKFRKRNREEDKPEDDKQNLENITESETENEQLNNASEEDNENFDCESSLYTFIYLLGAYCIRAGKRIFKGLRRIVTKPL